MGDKTTIARCAGCEGAVVRQADLAHCTVCGAHHHRWCAPRVATDSRLDQLVSLFAAGVHTSMLKAARNGQAACALATSACIVGLWGRLQTPDGEPAQRSRDAGRFARAAADLDDSFAAFAAELELLLVGAPASPDAEQAEERTVFGHFRLPASIAERYLGPLAEWIELPPGDVADRLRARGWRVSDADLVAETIHRMRTGTLPRLDPGESEETER